jgi:ADP-ribosylglycohydrolase
MNTIQDRIRGSLIGGAIGDALGYPIEFIKTYKGIQEKYGDKGITRLVSQKQRLDVEGLSDKAIISDDTQMTLFTANGILNAHRLKLAPKYAICMAYIEWYLTQIGKWDNKYKDCWIGRIPELNKQRGPGHTCLTALYTIYKGHEPYNTSKGDGGVMRVAPIPLYAIVNGRMSIIESDRLASDAAEITHKHPLGFIPAALVAHIIYRLGLDSNPTCQSLENYIHEGMTTIKILYPSYPYDVEYMGKLVEKAILLAGNNKPDVENIESIGGGWTGDEALAIALYCAIRHFNNFENALIAAVNHAGDSDSTGAITGNILGAAIGYEAIPEFFKDDLELHEVILHMADDLYRGEVTTIK